MAWDFSTDPEWDEQLAWVDGFVRSECEPIDLIVAESHDLNDPVRQALIPPLQQIVRTAGCGPPISVHTSVGRATAR